MSAARESLQAISGTTVDAHRKPAEKFLCQICSDLSHVKVDDVVNGGLHEYLDALQARMNQASTAIYEQFFAKRPPGEMPVVKERLQ